MGDLAEAMVPVAARLVGAVHDDGPGHVARVVNSLDAQEIRGLVVVLAAMVDPDRTPTELLGWVDWSWSEAQASLFSGWNLDVHPARAIEERLTPADAFDPVDVTGLILDDRRNWPDDVCHQLHMEDRHQWVAPERRKWTVIGRREWDRRRHVRARDAAAAKATSQTVQIPVP